MRRLRGALRSLIYLGVSAASWGLALGFDVVKDKTTSAIGLIGLVLLASCVDWLIRRPWEHDSPDQPPESVPEQPAGMLTDLPFTSGFTGRADDVAWIAEALRTEHAVAVLGRRAVGTSACAVQAANQVRDRFPDGQSYLDLRPRGRPLRPDQVLSALARKLGEQPPASRRPGHLEAAAHRLRARLADQCVLLVLDNVSHPGQVRALLPPAPACRLLLAGVPAVNTVEGLAVRWLSEPDSADAVQLFAAAAAAAPNLRPRRPDPHTDPAVPQLVELCGRQPRVVRALGWQLARHGWRSDELLGTIRRAIDTAPHLPVGHTAVLDLLCDTDVAYAALGTRARRLFRLLSLAGGEPLGRDAIGALTGYSRSTVDRTLDELAAAAFVAAASGDRYAPRPLLAGYARLHLRHDEPARRQLRAKARLVRHLADRAERHAAALTGTGIAQDDPEAWFELHHDLLRGQATGDFRLAAALSTWYADRADLDSWEAVCRAVLADEPDHAATGWAHNELGVVARRRGNPHDAAVELTVAVEHRRRRGAAQSRTNLGLARLDRGEVDEAIEHLDWARRHRSPADRAGQALSDLGLGAAYLARDEPAKARHHLVQAANQFDALDDRRGYAAALTDLAQAYWRLGEYMDAALAATTAVAEYRRVEDPHGLAAALLTAGAIVGTGERGHADQAYRLLSEGLRLRADWPPTAGRGRTLLYLGDAADALGRPDEAYRHWTDAADTCDEAGDAAGAAEAQRRLRGK